MSILIALEGLDGCGKSTLSEALTAQLSQDPTIYPWVYNTKEPGSMWTGIGPEIRKLVLTTPEFQPVERELLFYVDASLHRRFIENQGQAVIVSDRGVWSHLAYLRGYLKSGQLNYEHYQLCKKFIDVLCAKPDCVIYMRGDLELMKERTASRNKDAIEANNDKFFSAVLETYEDLVTDRTYQGLPLLVLDSRDNLESHIVKVTNYLKEVFNAEELRQGNRELCRI